ncbi:MAG: hypothetical protein N2512_15245, partial [Armatimonadetes bacterium]|nr:hypothetical protein [Armatimonadota bacterium]
ELRLPDEVRAAMSRAMQGLTAGAGDLSQWVGWLAPILPEGPVAPGATWELTTPLAGLAGIQALPQITTVYSYEGMEEINGVPCHKITAKSSAADIDLTLPAAWGMGVETRLEGFSFDSHLTSYLSSTDTQLLLLKGAVTQAGTIHAKGTLQQGGQQIPVDQTVRMDCLAVSIEARRD